MTFDLISRVLHAAGRLAPTANQPATAVEPLEPRVLLSASPAPADDAASIDTIQAGVLEQLSKKQQREVRKLDPSDGWSGDELWDFAEAADPDDKLDNRLQWRAHDGGPDGRGEVHDAIAFAQQVYGDDSEVADLFRALLARHRQPDAPAGFSLEDLRFMAGDDGRLTVEEIEASDTPLSKDGEKMLRKADPQRPGGLKVNDLKFIARAAADGEKINAYTHPVLEDTIAFIEDRPQRFAASDALAIFQALADQAPGFGFEGYRNGDLGKLARLVTKDGRLSVEEARAASQLTPVDPGEPVFSNQQERTLEKKVDLVDGISPEEAWEIAEAADPDDKVGDRLRDNARDGGEDRRSELRDALAFLESAFADTNDPHELDAIAVFEALIARAADGDTPRGFSLDDLRRMTDDAGQLTVATIEASDAPLLDDAEKFLGRVDLENADGLKIGDVMNIARAAFNGGKVKAFTPQVLDAVQGFIAQRPQMFAGSAAEQVFQDLEDQAPGFGFEGYTMSDLRKMARLHDAGSTLSLADAAEAYKAMGVDEAGAPLFTRQQAKALEGVDFASGLTPEQLWALADVADPQDKLKDRRSDRLTNLFAEGGNNGRTELADLQTFLDAAFGDTTFSTQRLNDADQVETVDITAAAFVNEIATRMQEPEFGIGFSLTDLELMAGDGGVLDVIDFQTADPPLSDDAEKYLARVDLDNPDGLGVNDVLNIARAAIDGGRVGLLTLSLIDDAQRFIEQRPKLFAGSAAAQVFRDLEDRAPGFGFEGYKTSDLKKVARLDGDGSTLSLADAAEAYTVMGVDAAGDPLFTKDQQAALEGVDFAAGLTPEQLWSLADVADPKDRLKDRGSERLTYLISEGGRNNHSEWYDLRSLLDAAFGDTAFSTQQFNDADVLEEVDLEAFDFVTAIGAAMPLVGYTLTDLELMAGDDGVLDVIDFQTADPPLSDAAEKYLVKADLDNPDGLGVNDVLYIARAATDGGRVGRLTPSLIDDAQRFIEQQPKLFAGSAAGQVFRDLEDRAPGFGFEGYTTSDLKKVARLDGDGSTLSLADAAEAYTVMGVDAAGDPVFSNKQHRVIDAIDDSGDLTVDEVWAIVEAADDKRKVGNRLTAVEEDGYSELGAAQAFANEAFGGTAPGTIAALVARGLTDATIGFSEADLGRMAGDDGKLSLTEITNGHAPVSDASEKHLRKVDLDNGYGVRVNDVQNLIRAASEGDDRGDLNRARVDMVLAFLVEHFGEDELDSPMAGALEALGARLDTTGDGTFSRRDLREIARLSDPKGVITADEA